MSNLNVLMEAIAVKIQTWHQQEPSVNVELDTMGHNVNLVNIRINLLSFRFGRNKMLHI